MGNLLTSHELLALDLISPDKRACVDQSDQLPACRQCGSNPGSPCSVLSRPERGSGKFPGHFKSKQLNRLVGLPAVLTAVSGKLNLLKKTTFYDLRVSQFTRVYKCPVFGARGNSTTFGGQ
jgi:hypothetical protein